MQIPITCRECGYQEWGSSDRPLMNRIKLLNHAVKEHPDNVSRVLTTSLPKERPTQLPVSSRQFDYFKDLV